MIPIVPHAVEWVEVSRSTVKPLALMRWLVKLITPPGGTVLDCFAGSGSTLVACALDGYEGIGVEMDPAYVEICRRRVREALGPLFAQGEADV